MTTPEVIGSILPRTEAGQVAEVARLSEEGHAALDEFAAAQERLAELTKQEVAILQEIMQLAIQMHAAKVRADAAVKAVRDLAGLV